jgi:methyl acetate hydrolase
MATPMNRARTPLLRTALAAVAMAVLVASVGARPPALSTAGAAALTQRLDAATRRGEVPAVVVLVTNADDVMFEHAAGRRDVSNNAPLSENAIFRIASMGKPVTSAAIMMLMESGRLGLDGPANRYLPSIDALKVVTQVNPDGSLELRPPRRAITIRDLLTHTSGIGYSFSDPVLFKLQQSGKGEQDLPLLHDPGEKWTYGASTRYLGDIVERVSGQPLDTFLRTRLLEPLEMADTSFELAADARARLVTVHQRVNGVLMERPNPDVARNLVRGDGGQFSTARDYGKFLRLFLNGGRAGPTRLLAESSIRDMTRNQIGQLVVRRQPAANAAVSKPFPLGGANDYWGFGDTWGLGFQLSAPTTLLHRRAPGSYSWAGINNTHFWVDPQRQIAVVVLMQVLPFYDDACIQLLTDVEELVNQAVSAPSQ